MKAFVWDQNFVTGLDQVDEQHRFLVDLINRFGDALVASKSMDDAALGKVFGELAKYAQYHFATEERLMQEWAVAPGHRGPHVQRHADFINQVSSMWSARGTLSNPAEVLHGFLCAWLAFHVLGEDQDMGRQIALIGAGSSPAEAFELSRKPLDNSTAGLLGALRNLYGVLAEQNRDLARVNEQLGERVKELRCLDKVAGLAGKPGQSVSEVLREAVQLLPPAWYYPDVAAARITFDQNEFATSNFRETPWTLSTRLKVDGVVVGTVEVCYLEERPPRDEGPFLAEERTLINALAAQLGVMVEQKNEEQRSRCLLELVEASEHLDEKALLQRGLDVLQGLTRSRIGFLHFVSEDQNEIELVTWTTDTMASYCQASYDRHYPVSQAGIWADSIRQKRAIVVNDYAAAPDKRGLPDGHAHLQRFASVPVFDAGLVRMIVGVGNAAHDYSERDVTSINLFANDMYRIVQRRRAAQAVRENEAIFRHFMDNSPVYVFFKDENIRSLMLSRNFEAMLGKPVAELLGKNMDELFPSDFARAMVADDMKVLREGKPVTLDEEFNGRFYSTIKFPIAIDGKPRYLAGYTIDVTERREAEAKIRRLTQLYAALSQCNEAIVRCTSEEELFPRICRVAVQFGGMKMAWIGRLNTGSQTIQAASSFGDGAEEYLKGIAISTDADTPFGRGPTGTAVRENRAVWCEDFQNDPMTAPWHERGAQLGFRASAALPLYRGGNIVGALTLYAGEAYAFDEGARGLLIEMSTDIGFAMENFSREAARNQAERAARNSQAQLQSILDNSGLVIFLKDLEGRFIFVNQRFAELFHVDRDSIADKTDFDLYPPEHAERFRQHDRLALESGKPVEMQEMVPQDDGTHTYISSKFPLFDSGGRPYAVCGIATDVTERLSAEEKFRAIVEQSLVGVYMLDGVIVRYANPRVAEIFGVDPGKVLGASFLPYVVDEDKNKVQQVIERLARRETQVARVEYRIRRAGGESAILGAEARLAEVAGKSFVMGVVQDITEKVRAEERVGVYVARLERAVLGTVDAVSQMMDRRDPYTSGHERRVGEIAAAIAAEMGLDSEAQRGIRVAGGVHDVGKISVPAEILAKPGQITPLELEIIKTHAQEGYEILKDIDFPWPVAEIARQHHERFDGSGYPRGLKGEQILPEARILAVADVMEAMASHRPYRPGLGLDKALAEVERGRGSAYDPTAADACLRLFREKGYAIPA